MGYSLHHLSKLLGHAREDPLGTIEILVLGGILAYILHGEYEIIFNNKLPEDLLDHPIVGVFALVVFGLMSLKAVVDFRRVSRDR